MKLIANLICQDSTPELPLLLKSLEGRIDALVAVDGGSSDGTVALLLQWGEDTGTAVVAKTIPWQDDFALQRNMCLNVTRAEFGISSPGNDIWVLAIDSDDTLAEFDRTFIEANVAQNDIGGLLCRMDNGNGFFNVCQCFRLTADAVWEDPIHEHITLKDKRRGLPPAGTLTIRRGRSEKHDADPERNVRIGRRFVEACPDEPRARFYLARDLYECPAIPDCQRLAESEGHLRVYLAMKCGFVTQDRYARVLLARLLSETGRREEARRMMLDSLAHDPDNRSAYECLARLSEAQVVAGVWGRLAASAEGPCVLPYASRLPHAAQSHE